MRVDLIFKMRNYYINSNMVPLKKLAVGNVPNLKISPWNIS